MLGNASKAIFVRATNVPTQQEGQVMYVDLSLSIPIFIAVMLTVCRKT